MHVPGVTIKAHLATSRAVVQALRLEALHLSSAQISYLQSGELLTGQDLTGHAPRRGAEVTRFMAPRSTGHDLAVHDLVSTTGGLA